MQFWDDAEREHCPGFCGKIVLNSSGPFDEYSDCQPCPWGSQVDIKSKCNECDSNMQGYDFAFIIFHALAPLLINILFIKSYSIKQKKQKIPRIWVFLQFLSAAFEAVLSLIFTLLIYKPIGSLHVYTCQNNFLYEWYPMLFNPLVNYTHIMRCTSEVVYPRYSLPFANLAFNLLNLIVLRSIVYAIAYAKSPIKIPSEPYYAVLWTLPILAIAHAAFSGIIYYIFPYITLFTSLALNAFHFAYEGRKNIKQIFRLIFKDPDHILMLLIHMMLFGFAIFSLYLSTTWQSYNPGYKSYAVVAGLLPLPSIFYILTIKLTVPPRNSTRAIR
uniref:JNK1/MAPK8-associated membrane protein n=1 Tax=Panagrolaimus davidi TaxID=227884 RepID=A0A914Q4D8_9BILA